SFIRVDFPAPFSPTSASTSPWRTSRRMSSRACTPGKPFETPSMDSSGGVGEPLVTGPLPWRGNYVGPVAPSCALGTQTYDHFLGIRRIARILHEAGPSNIGRLRVVKYPQLGRVGVSRSCSRSRRCSAPVRISRCAPALYPGAMTTPSLRTRIQHRLIRALGGEATPSGQPGTTALVISGGGARSSFELGALQYLYEQGGIAPNIITGTSAGSILAAVIAQYQDPQAQLQAVRQLRSLWLAMEDSSDMFTELPWFTKLNEHMPTWRKVMALRNRSRHRPHRSRSMRLGSDSPPSHDTRAHDSARTHEGGDPDHTPPDHGLAWSVTNVLDAMSTLWEAGRTSTDLELILTGAQQERAAFRPGPIVQQLTDPDLFVPATVAGSGISLRI